MNDAIHAMLEPYACKTSDEYEQALREILQELALLGLWRSKFFEHAAFYGDTALRILHGLDRFSEDLNFSLLKPNPDFSLDPFAEALSREIESFGFQITFESKKGKKSTAIESAFLKANTCKQLIVIQANEQLVQKIHPKKILKIKIEVDTDPPSGFETEFEYLLQPIPFAVRTYSLPDLFAGKLHAVLCRKWKSRVKGRDWYDLVWYAARHPTVHLSHLETRMRQSGDYQSAQTLTLADLKDRLIKAIATLDVQMAKTEVMPFVQDRRAIELWSREFFTKVIKRIKGIS